MAEKPKVNWSDAKPKKSDVVAGVIIGAFCLVLVGSIFLANYIFIGH